MKLVVQVTRLDQYHNGWCPLPCSNSGSLRHHLDSSLGWPRVDSVMKKATYFGVNQTIQIYGYSKGSSLITMHFWGLVSYNHPCWDERLDDFVEFHKDEAIVSIVESLFFARKRFDLPSRELTYPTWGKWKSSPKVPWYGISVILRVVSGFLLSCFSDFDDGGSCWPHPTKARPRTIWKSAKSRCQTVLGFERSQFWNLWRNTQEGSGRLTDRAPQNWWQRKMILSFWNMVVRFQGRTIY